jgi:lipid II:glycine glycyltransferase (peptidoglycan interpeptide bridge formation enzyme)
MENMSPDQPQFQTSVDVKLDYIQRDIRDIKDTLKDTPTRREFNEAINDLNKQIIPIQDYKTDKARVWIAIAILMALGGTIIALSIMAINSKIKDGITQALSQYNIEVK